jgi:hypothetical protein
MIFCKCKCRYLLAIDPGLATGVCLIDLIDPETPVKVWSVEVTDTEFYDKIAGLIAHESTHVVIEKFTITTETGKLTEAPWSLEHIGIVKYWCYKLDKELNIQTPAEAKDFATNEKLKAVDFWHVGGEGHANDSLRHAMVWIVNRNRKWTRKLLV